MARARNIKPSFFLNEDIVELPYEARLLFIGLWTLADREGRLENRPKKIKMSLFPADDINVSEQLSNISKYGFIKLYNTDDLDVIQIENFVKHQTPHGLEKDSDLPDYKGMYTAHFRNQKNKTITGKPVYLKRDQLSDFYNKGGEFSTKKIDQDAENSCQSLNTKGNNDTQQIGTQVNNSYETVSISDQNALNPESFNLNPESFNLNPDSLNPVLRENTNTQEENSVAQVWNPNLETLDSILKTTKYSHRVSEIIGLEDFQFHLGNFNTHHENNFQLTDNQKHRKFAQWMIQEFEKSLEKAERKNKQTSGRTRSEKPNSNLDVNTAWSAQASQNHAPVDSPVHIPEDFV